MSQTRQRNKTRYDIPADLLQPLWLRSRESLNDDHLVYDPIAASACSRCQLAPECLSGDVHQKQLLHVTMTKLCDEQVSKFLQRYPDGWIVNLGAGLDTRFYRVDNGRCHWVELDTNENLLWREKLFHKSERYKLLQGSVIDLTWLEQLEIPDGAPVMVVCEQALLSCTEAQVASVIQGLGRHFVNASTCLVVAGDLASSSFGRKMGNSNYAHGFRDPIQSVLHYLPWASWSKVFSPLDRNCDRWKLWQRWVRKMGRVKYRISPVLVQLRW